jgi:hypothetical protein
MGKLFFILLEEVGELVDLFGLELIHKVNLKQPIAAPLDELRNHRSSALRYSHSRSIGFNSGQ